MTVVKLEVGGLLVHAGRPDSECVRLVKELVAEHGDVSYIILPTVSGLEHKVSSVPSDAFLTHWSLWLQTSGAFR